jgi:iron complex transport system permease protein
MSTIGKEDQDNKMTPSTESVETGTKSTEIKEQYKKFIGRKILFIFFSLISIVIIAGIAATLGSYQITVLEVYSIIWHGIPKILQNTDFIIAHGFKDFFQTYFTTEEIVVWDLRLPRIIMGILAGIGLAIAGTMMQGILRNPLASPFTIGIASGAGFGATLAICFGTGFVIGEYLIIGNAFLFALIPTFIILGLARYRSATPETMILAGIALFYVFSGLIALALYFSEAEPAIEAYFWMVGSLSGRASEWKAISPVFIVLAGCIIPLMWKSWDVNVMGAGDETAKSLGVNVERTRIFIMMITSLLTAGIICFTGTIGFIGLVAPHICRIVIGGDNRFLIPASGLFGAALLLGADTVARTIIVPMALPVGILTYLMGGPLFLYLIIRRKREYW